MIKSCFSVVLVENDAKLASKELTKRSPSHSDKSSSEERRRRKANAPRHTAENRERGMRGERKRGERMRGEERREEERREEKIGERADRIEDLQQLDLHL